MWTDPAQAALIARISERLSKTSRRAYPTSVAEIERIERRLGLMFPPFLRRLYMQVGDGGFGPGLDVEIPGYPAGLLWSLSRVADAYEHSLTPLAEFPSWPRQLLPIATLGGDLDVAVDCSDPDHPVLALDADRADLGSGGVWVVLANCVEQWMADWLDGNRRPFDELPIWHGAA